MAPLVDQQLAHAAGAGRKAPQTAKGLGQRPNVDVHAARGRLHLSGAAAVGAANEGGVGVVDHEQKAVAAAEAGEALDRIKDGNRSVGWRCSCHRVMLVLALSGAASRKMRSTPPSQPSKKPEL